MKENLISQELCWEVVRMRAATRLGCTGSDRSGLGAVVEGQSSSLVTVLCKEK